MNDELYEKLASLRWLLHKRRLRGWAHRGPLADHTQGQGRILAFLKLRDNISTKELSYLLGIAVSSLNELLAKLEKSGHVTREPSEEDKRVMLVRLTEKGRSEEQPEISDRSDIFACLSEAEQGTLEDYLDRIIAALEKD
ncbi:MAG: MarR family transcriptional regulator, partial [Gracilibacteraceae bacterium]|nr:MarR family transcriptional regulator [Gracilibacteraceae bacterium]